MRCELKFRGGVPLAFWVTDETEAVGLRRFGYCWRSCQATAGMAHETGEGGLAGPLAAGSCKPAADVAEVDGGCGKHTLEVRLGQPDVAGPAQMHGAGDEVRPFLAAAHQPALLAGP